MPTTIVAATCPVPACNLAPRHVVSVVTDLVAYTDAFLPDLSRKDQAPWAYRYLQGLVSDHPRKSIEPIALALAFPIHTLQAFIGTSRWRTAALVQRQQKLLAQTLGADDAVILVDESGMPNQGQHSAAVAPQYCAALGKLANCQLGVFLGYASRKGYTLPSGQLFVPAPWFADDHATLRQQVDMPAEMIIKPNQSWRSIWFKRC
jgi:SRSO17 transposase